MYRVVQQKFALLIQLHHGDGGDGLGHGVDAEHGIPFHGQVAFDISQALGFTPENLAMPGHQRDRPRNLAGLNIVLVKVAGNTLQAIQGNAGGD